MHLYDRIGIAILLACAVFAGVSCQEPVTYQPDVPVANAASYTFDFVMLAEWGGRIYSEPTDSSAFIYSNDAGQLFAGKQENTKACHDVGDQAYNITETLAPNNEISITIDAFDCPSYTCQKLDTMDDFWCRSNTPSAAFRHEIYRCKAENETITDDCPKPNETGFDAIIDSGIMRLVTNQKCVLPQEQTFTSYKPGGAGQSGGKLVAFSSEITPYEHLCDEGKDFRTTLTCNQEKIYLCNSETALYNCKPYVTGVHTIQYVWEHIFTNDRNQFYVASGDSYGVSQAVSRSTDDVATAIMLNYLGVDADTFGNHSFNDNINYMQNIINTAKYAYTASNLINVPQNLNDVSPYIILEAQPDNPADNPLRIGLIGIIDKDIIRAVFPGRFGSLAIDDIPCALVQTLEEAHNQGARAFFITGHLSIGAESTYKTLVTLTALKQYPESEVLPNTNRTPSPDNPYSVQNWLESCPSKLQLPENTVDKAAYIKQQRRIIFNEIAGVFAEAGNNILYPVTTDSIKIITEGDKSTASNSKSENFSNPQCIYNNEGTIVCDTLQDYLWYKSIKSDSLSAFELIDALSLEYKDLSSSDLEEKNSLSPLWYFQIASKGSVTSRASFTATKSSDNPGEYDVSLSQYQMIPVLSPAADITTSDNETKSLADISPQDCIKLAHNLYNYSLYNKEAAPYTDGLFSCLGTFACQTPQHFGDPEDTVYTKTQISEDETIYCFENNGSYTLRSDKNNKLINTKSPEANSAEQCLNMLADISHSDAPALNMQVQSALLACLYHSENSVICYNKRMGNQKYTAQNYQNLILKYLGITIPEYDKKAHRNYSTFISNLFTDSIYNYYNNIPITTVADAKAPSTDSEFNVSDVTQLAFDLVFMNSGTLRESASLSYITNADVHNWVPFGNKIDSISTSIEDFITLLETNLWNANDGSFPLISGGVFAYVDTPESTHITELWQVNYKQELIRPLYIKNCSDAPKSPIAGYACASDGDVIHISIKADSSKLPLSSALEEHDEFILSRCRKGNDAGYCLEHVGMNKYLRIISSDFLFTGGDGYTLPQSYSKEPIVNHYIDETIISYLTGNTAETPVSSASVSSSQQPIAECVDNNFTSSNSDDSETISREYLRIWCTNRQYLLEGQGNHQKYIERSINPRAKVSFCSEFF